MCMCKRLVGYVHGCIYIHMHMYIHIHIYIHIYKYAYTHTYTTDDAVSELDDDSVVSLDKEPTRQDKLDKIEHLEGVNTYSI